MEDPQTATTEPTSELERLRRENADGNLEAILAGPFTAEKADRVAAFMVPPDPPAGVTAEKWNGLRTAVANALQEEFLPDERQAVASERAG